MNFVEALMISKVKVATKKLAQYCFAMNKAVLFPLNMYRR